MRKIIAIFSFFALCAVAAQYASARLVVGQSVVVPAADAKGEKLLAMLSAKIAGLGDYRVDFRAYVEGSQMTGRYLVSGRKFRIMTGEFDVIGDGGVRYEINHRLEEVVVDYMDTTDVNILTNPTRAFEFVSAGFSPSYEGEVVVDGQRWDVVEMKPVFGGAAIARIMLYIDRANGLPAQVSYRIEELGEDVDVMIDKFEGGERAEPSEFRFDRSKYSSYEVIDFR